MEVQEKAFCLVHTFNMALGKKLITGTAVLSYAQNLENCRSERMNKTHTVKCFHDQSASNIMAFCLY